MKKRNIEKKTALKALYLEDSPKDVEIIQELLADAGFVLFMDCTEKKKEFTALLRRNKYDVILSDFSVPGFDAFGALKLVIDICPAVPFIVVSGSIGEETAIELIKQGAVDYILKDRMARLPVAIKRAMEVAKEKESRERTAVALRESERRFRETLENVKLISVQLDLNGCIIFCNDFLLQLSGYKSNEIIGKDWFLIFVPEARTDVKEEFLNALKLGNISPFYENPIRIKNGTERMIRFSNTLLRDGRGNVIGTTSIGEDITERKLIEEALQKSKNELVEYFENDISADYVVSVEGIIFSCNTTFLKMFGFDKKSQAERFDITQLYKNPDDRIKLLQMVRENKKVENYEIDFISKDGRPINAIINAIGIYNEFDELTQIRGYIVDITDKIIAEKALEEKENRLRLIVEGTPYLFFYTQDTTAKITYISPSVEYITGHTIEEWSNQLDWFITDNIINEYAKERTHAHLNGEIIDSSFLVEVEHADKYPILLEIFESPIIQDGRVVGLQGVAHNITERKLAEEALRNNETRLRTLLQSIPDLIWLKDINGVFLACNSMFERLFGARQKDIIGKTDYDFMDTELADFFRENDKRAIAAGKPTSNEEWVIFADDGQRVLLETIKAPMYDSSSNLLGVLGIGRDITSRKEAQNKILKSEEKLRALNARLEKVKEEERINLSRELHDNLGQNLTGLKMQISYFAKKVKTDRFSNPADLLLRTSDMLSLIDAMINTVRKISAELRPNVLDYLGLIPAIEWQIGELKKRSEIDCEMKSKVEKIDLGIQINSSVFRIVQEAFTNIIRHAEATKVILSIYEEDDRFKLEILDNGIGIKETDISNIRSLGVIGMKERTIQFNGTLQLQNAPQGGTLLTLIIPKVVN